MSQKRPRLDLNMVLVIVKLIGRRDMNTEYVPPKSVTEEEESCFVSRKRPKFMHQR